MGRHTRVKGKTGRHRDAETCPTCQGSGLEYATNGKPYQCSNCGGNGKVGRHRK